MLKNWGTRDWVWLSSYFIVIVSLLLANYYLEWKTNLSIISSAVSIALAVIAIFLALKQDSENKISTDSKHMDLSQQLRDLNTALLSKKAGIEDVVTNVEESLKAKKEEKEEKESYSYEQLKEYGEKVKKDTIDLFKKELNNQLFKDLKIKNIYSFNEDKIALRAKERKMIQDYIMMVEEYTVSEVVNYLKNNGIYSTEERVQRIIDLLTYDE